MQITFQIRPNTLGLWPISEKTKDFNINTLFLVLVG